MARTFAAQVDAWASKSDRRMTAIFRESTQRVGEQAQTNYNEGGKLPIDTGFLRQSYSVSLSGMPFGVSVPPDGQSSFSYDSGPVDLVIASAGIGDVISGGWVANYAIYMEERFGFLRSAAQNWSAIVNEVTAEAKVRFP